MMSDGAIPNQSLLKKEHEGLIKILNKHFLDTVSIPFEGGLEKNKKYDFVFMRDHFLCNTSKEIVMCNMKLFERMNEGKSTISPLENLNYKISYLGEDCVAEGGEFFYLSKENILLAGQNRNNLKGAEQMAEKLNVSNLFIINSRGYHLDTSIAPLFNSKYDCIGIICAKEVFNRNEFKNLKNICDKNHWDVIEVEHQNIQKSISFRTAMNGLTLPGLFISSEKLNHKAIIDFGLENDITFDFTSVSQFNLSGGSVHCLTNELF